MRATARGWHRDGHRLASMLLVAKARHSQALLARYQYAGARSTGSCATAGGMGPSADTLVGSTVRLPRAQSTDPPSPGNRAGSLIEGP